LHECATCGPIKPNSRPYWVGLTVNLFHFICKRLPLTPHLFLNPLLDRETLRRLVDHKVTLVETDSEESLLWFAGAQKGIANSFKEKVMLPQYAHPPFQLSLFEAHPDKRVAFPIEDQDNFIRPLWVLSGNDTPESIDIVMGRLGLLALFHFGART
jgi:hypothetical protein